MARTLTTVVVLLAAATTLAAAAQSQCKCELTDCKQATRKVCSVSEGAPREVCTSVQASEDVIECTQKCYSGHRLAALAAQGSSSSAAKGRRLLEEDALSVDHHLTVSNDSSAMQQAAPLEVCSEICRPGKKPTGQVEQRCEMVASKQHIDCRTEAVASECVKRCECGGRVVISRAASSDAPGITTSLASLASLQGARHLGL